MRRFAGLLVLVVGFVGKIHALPTMIRLGYPIASPATFRHKAAVC
jgi:hypothetical protein